MASNRRQLLPFGLEWADMAATNVESASEYPLPINGAPTARELRRIRTFSNLVANMKTSSFYSGNFDTLKKRKGAATDHLEGGVNDGIKRYSDKYRKRIKIGRAIADHPFQHALFPSELQSVLGVRKKGSRAKTLNVSAYSNSQINGDLEKNLDKLMSEKKEILDRLNDMEANASIVGINDDDDNNGSDQSEENVDDEFEDDDDDDYNAEKYFDDGDDYDGGDGDDAGDDEAAF